MTEWDIDILIPTIPEYIEHHKQMQELIALITNKTKEVKEK